MAKAAAQSFVLPTRQAHLDFHTGPQIPDIGQDFDAREFARTVKQAHINSVTLFAKCHHGHLYYNTKRAERHPGLKPGFDLLAQQVEALHREGIRAPIYLSVQCDEYAANTHPEWVARNPDSSQVKWAPTPDRVFGAGWQILDMSSPYADYLADQTAEVLKLFRPVDGIFYDMTWDQPSSSPWAIAGMIKENLNPEKAEDRSLYANRVAKRYMKRYYDQVKARAKDASVFFNSRPFNKFAEECQWQTQAEIEALPTGGWGYMYFPMNVRFARTFPRPYLGMTARFHKTWADFGGLKPYAALEYETSQMAAHGAACSIGDQLHPRGVLDRAAYELIGRAYHRLAEREPWLTNVHPECQIGLFQATKGIGGDQLNTDKSDEGATRLLTQLKLQFDVVQATSNFERYELLILPDGVAIDSALAKRLKAYVKNGGKILASGLAGLSPDARALTLDFLGIAPRGFSPFTANYLRFASVIAQDVPPTDHICYDRSIRITAQGGATVLGKFVEPYFERAWNHFSSHNQTPPDKVSRYAVAVQNGSSVYISFPVFRSFAEHGNLPYRLLVRNLLRRLLPDALLEIDGPSYLEATVMRQEKRRIVHLLAYAPERRTATLDIVEDIVPLREVPLSLRLERRPACVYLAPEHENLPFEYRDGRVHVIIPEVRGHAMVVFE